MRYIITQIEWGKLPTGEPYPHTRTILPVCKSKEDVLRTLRCYQHIGIEDYNAIITEYDLDNRDYLEVPIITNQRTASTWLEENGLELPTHGEAS